jgi:EmrB/QacA subfamily drug resistance transporter
MELKRVPYKWIVAAIFVTGLFMDIMDTTIINVAIPSLVKDLHTTASSVEWVVLGYLLSLAVWIPASGWVGDRIGTKKTFLFALFAFTAASALCGLSQSVGQLIVFRILQGVGGGMLTPVGTAMLFRAFPPAERAKASAVLLVPAILAPALGPVIGGWLVTDVSWRLIFFVNLPVGVAGFIFGALFLKEHKEPTAGRFDLPGFVLSGGGLALSLYALSQGPSAGWGSATVLWPGIIGVTMFVGLVIVELKTDQPMLDLRLFRERMFRNANIVMILAVAGLIGVLFLLPQFLQDLRGLSALQSGLATFPQAIGMMISIRFVAKLYPKVGPRRIVIVGLLAVTATTSCFLFVDLNTSLWLIRGIMLLRGVAMAAAFIPMQAATYSNISRADTGRASALYSTQRQVGSAFGVAILATVWISRTKSLTGKASGDASVLAARVAGFHDAFLVAALLALVAAGAALMIRDSDAAASLPTSFGKLEATEASEVMSVVGGN